MSSGDSRNTPRKAETNLLARIVARARAGKGRQSSDSFVYQIEELERRLFLSTAIAAFQTQQTFATGTSPFSVAMADVNGDGKSDLLAANFNGASVSVLLGNGNGTFQPQKTFAAGASPYCVVSSDVNGDGKADLITANSASNTVSVLLGNENGTFQPQQTFAVGTHPFTVVLADFNADGKPDLVVANSNSNNVSLLLGNGNGTFQAQQTLAVGTKPVAVVAADMNGDGRPDLVVTNSNSNNVSVLLGSGGTIFQPQQTFAAGSVVYSLAVADLNGDGVPDVVVANDANNTISLLQGNGNGTLQPQKTFAVGTNPFSVAVSDVNRDGKLDVVVANFNSSNIGVLVGNGNGTLQTQLTFAAATHPSSVALSDVNNDGRPDLAVVNQGSNNVSVLLGEVPLAVLSINRTTPPGPLTSDSSVTYTVTFNEPVTGVDATDFTLALSGVAATTPVVVSGSGAVYSITINAISGTGTLQLSLVDDGSIKDAAGNSLQAGNIVSFQNQPTSATGQSPASVVAADVNGDGKADLIVANENSNTVGVLLGNGDGTFLAQQTVATGPDPLSVVAFDMNGDGKLDLVVANGNNNTISLLLGNGNGTFQSQQAVSVGTGSYARLLAVADVNGDGRPDVAVGNGASKSTVTVLLSNGGGTFQTPRTFATGSYPRSVALADVNGDGRLDLIVGNDSSNSISVLLGNGNGTFAAQQTFATGIDPIALALSDLNGDGKLDVAVANFGSNSASVLLGNGNGTFQSQRTFATGAQPFYITIADINRDGPLDLIVPDQTTGSATGSVTILEGVGDGTFQPQQTFPAGQFPVAVAVADFNADGKPDMAVTNAGSSNVRVYLNSSNGNFAGQIYTIIPSLDTITGTAGVDQITLAQDPDHTHIDWTLGSTTAQLLINDPKGLTINGNGSTDVITLDYTFGNPLPNLLNLNGVFNFPIGLLFQGGTISGGTMVFSGGSQLVVQNTSSDGAVLDGVTINGNIDLTTQPAGALLSVTHGLTLNGTATLGGIGDFDSFGSVWFDGTQTLSGNANILFVGTNNGDSVFVPNGPDTQHVSTLTLGPNVLIHGQQGYVGSDPSFTSGAGGPVNARSIVNNGTIDADTSGGAISVSAVDWSNPGTLEAQNGATLNVLAEALGGTTESGGAFTNSGTVLAAAQSTVNIQVATYTNQGSVQGTGGGVVNVNVSGTSNFTGGNVTVTGTVTSPSVAISGGDISFVSITPVSIPNLTLSGGILDGSAALTVTATSTLTGGKMAGTGTTTIAANAIATVNGTVTATRPFVNAGAVNISTGVLALKGGGNHTGSFSITQGANLLIGGTANQAFQAGSSLSGDGTLQFIETASAQVSGAYNVALTEMEQQAATSFTSNASTTSLVITGGVLTVGGSAQGGAAPALAPAVSGSTLTVTGNGVCSGGTIVVLAANTLQIAAPLSFVGGTNLINLASDSVSPGTLLLGGDVSFTTGTATVQTTGVSTDAGILDLGGTQRNFTINDGPATEDMTVSATITDGSIRKSGAGRLQFTAANTYAGGTTASGGVLEADNAASLGTGSVVFQGGTIALAGTSLVLNGQLTAAPTDSVSIDVGTGRVQAPGATLGSALNVTGSGGLLWINGPVTLQAPITINNSANVEITGAISGSFSITKTLAGTLTFDGTAANTFSGGTIVNGGTLVLNKPASTLAVPTNLTINGPTTVQLFASGQISSAALLTLNSVPGLAVLNLNGKTQTLAAINDTGGGSLMVGGGMLVIGGGVSINSGTLAIGAGGASAIGQLTIGGLGIIGGGKLDLTNNTLLINYTGNSDPIATIRSYLLSGYNGGAWNGSGIISANAAANAAQTTAIGYADSADGLIVGRPANTIELKYTLYGDTALTTSVGFNDFTRLTQHYNQTSGGAWDTGDFNYDGSVNSADFTLLTRTYNTGLGSQALPATQTTASASAAAPVNKPANTKLTPLVQRVHPNPAKPASHPALRQDSTGR